MNRTKWICVCVNRKGLARVSVEVGTCKIFGVDWQIGDPGELTQSLKAVCMTIFFCWGGQSFCFTQIFSGLAEATTLWKAIHLLKIHWFKCNLIQKNSSKLTCRSNHHRRIPTSAELTSDSLCLNCLYKRWGSCGSFHIPTENRERNSQFGILLHARQSPYVFGPQ